MSRRLLKLTVNGREREDAISGHTLLVEYLRDVAGLTGTKRGCDGGECGACTVLVDGEPRLACITLAASVEGRAVETIESLAANGRMSRLQQAFHDKLGTQCGFCTPGMIMSAEALLRRNPSPTEQRDTRRSRRQPVPLHRLREDHRVGPVRLRRWFAGRGLRWTREPSRSRRTRCASGASAGRRRSSTASRRSPAARATPRTCRPARRSSAAFCAARSRMA